MALWGNNDNINSGGTVTLNYSTGVVIGSGTSFGNVGSAQTGDVIRFGSFPYFGDAVIVGIASTTQLTIGSTSALSGAAISGQQYSISQLPKYTTQDVVYSVAAQNSPSTTTILTAAASTSVGINTTLVFVVTPVGVVTTGDLFTSGSNINIAITSVGSTTVSLASTTLSGIATGAPITFTRNSGARSAFVAGVSTTGVGAATSTAFEIGVGWVGVTTYKDFWGNLRVKKEILVAISGITTGNEPIYDNNPLV